MSKIYPYTLNRVMIAAYDFSAGTYSTPVSLAADQQFTIEPETDTDQLRDSGQIARLLTVYIGAKITIGAGGMDFDEMAIMEGGTKTTSTDGSDDILALKTASGGAGLPYFGVIGEAASDTGNVVVAGVRAIKLDMPLKKEFSGTENKFLVQEATGYAVAINNVVDVIKDFPDAASWASNMPVNGYDFGAFFTNLGS